MNRRALLQGLFGGLAAAVGLPKMFAGQSYVYMSVVGKPDFTPFVTTDEIAANAITTEKLTARAVIADQICISPESSYWDELAKLSPRSIDICRIHEGAITAGKIEPNAVRCSDEFYANLKNSKGLSAKDMLIDSEIITGRLRA